LRKVELVNLGRVVRSHGKEGFLKVSLYERQLPDFACSRIYLQKGGDRRAYRLESLEFKHNHCFLKLEGIDTQAQADRVVNCEVLAEASCFGRPGEGCYYQFEISGCRVVTVDGRELGEVSGIVEAGSNELLTVTDGKKEIFVPFVEAVCVRIEPREKLIVIDPPEGLLELNEV